MTLRCTIEIVPYGDENHKSGISKFDISNIGTVRDEGFGHVVCKYEVKRYDWDHFLKVFDDIPYIGVIEEHDRRDGAEELVRKVLVMSTKGELESE